eukprot:7389673-Prymnesium_polylepis.4
MTVCCKFRIAPFVTRTPPPAEDASHPEMVPPETLRTLPTPVTSRAPPLAAVHAVMVQLTNSATAPLCTRIAPPPTIDVSLKRRPLEEAVDTPPVNVIPTTVRREPGLTSSKLELPPPSNVPLPLRVML